MAMPGDLELDLLRRFARGEQAVFEAIFRQHHAEVRRWALRIFRDQSTADDVLVEAFWRAYRGRARFDPAQGFGRWMRRIATNAAYHHLQATRTRVASGTLSEEICAPEGSDDSVGESVAIAFRALPPKLRIVATLALIEERSYEEIADALDLPAGTIKSRVSRARRTLRSKLTRLGVEP